MTAHVYAAEEEEDSSLEEYKERLAEIDAEEMPAEDEEEEGESEADARERLRATLTEACEQQTEALSSLKVQHYQLKVVLPDFQSSCSLIVGCVQRTND